MLPNPKKKETARAATLAVSCNPNLHKRILPMNMVQTSNEINPRNAHHLSDALDELDHARDLCRLIHFAMEGLDKPRAAALRSGIESLETRLDCVTESIRWARSDAA